MFKLRRIIKYPIKIPAAWPLAIAVFITVLLSSDGFGQVGVEDKTIYIIGQITNNVNGAPISSHQVTIMSDSVTNNGFYYYSTLYTDVNGFYFDTVITQLNYGTINISLYDFENTPYEVDKIYRFNWSDDYQMIANFAIFDPNATSNFQANFDSQKDTTLTGSELKVYFSDLSTGYSIKSWWWDFDDGTYSDEQDPIHEYAGPGTYMVTLRVASSPPHYDAADTSTIMKMVTVGLADYYNMGGHVYSAYFPIDYGLAYLYMIDDEKEPIPIDTAVIDPEYGHYYFYQILEGDYFVKARLASNSQYYGEYIPTYYGDGYIWDEADTIHLDEEGWEYHISLITSGGVKQGDGQIFGTIGYDTNTMSATYAPAEDIEIILLNNNSACLTCKLSDLQGYFLFPDMAYGTYQIFPDVTGVHTEPMYITISEAEPGDDEIIVVIQDQEIFFGINEETSSFIENFGLVYPNPVKEQAAFEVNLKQRSSFQALILDQLGHAVYRKAMDLAKGKHKVLFSAAGFSPGAYTIILIDQDDVIFSRKFLKIE